jgi:hypothetical protein
MGRALQYRTPIFNYVAKDDEVREHELTSTEWDVLVHDPLSPVT